MYGLAVKVTTKYSDYKHFNPGFCLNNQTSTMIKKKWYQKTNPPKKKAFYNKPSTPPKKKKKNRTTKANSSPLVLGRGHFAHGLCGRLRGRPGAPRSAIVGWVFNDSTRLVALKLLQNDVLSFLQTGKWKHHPVDFRVLWSKKMRVLEGFWVLVAYFFPLNSWGLILDLWRDGERREPVLRQGELLESKNLSNDGRPPYVRNNIQVSLCLFVFVW